MNTNDYIKVKVIHQNVCSLRNKTNELEALLVQNKNEYDLICISEHFLHQDEIECLSIKDYTVASSFCRKSRSHGGTLILSKKEIKSVERTDITNLSMEMTCEISAIEIKKLNLIIVTIYRPPESNMQVFVNILENILKILSKKTCSVILNGDFNVNFNKFTNNKNIFLDVLESYDFSQQIFGNTRKTACLDNIFVNFHNILNFNAFVSSFIISDHNPVEIEVELIKNSIINNDSNTVHYHQPITEFGINAMYRHLEYSDWSFLQSECEFSSICKSFMDILITGMSKCFTTKKMFSYKNSKINWFNDTLRNMRENLKSLNEIYQNSEDRNIAIELKNAKKNYRIALSNAKIRANSAYVKNSKNPIKASWDIVNKHRVRNCDDNNLSISAQEFNTFFTNIAENIAKQIIPVQKDHHFYLNNRHNSNDQNQQNFIFNFREITFNEVRDTINKLSNKKSKDIYGMNMFLIKRIKNVLILPLTKFFNLCIREGEYPQAFKISKVIPIFKKGDKHSPNNYRPITIIPAISKIFEHLLKKQLYEYFENNKLFSNSQFGFRRNSSAEAAICNLMQCVVESFEGGKFVGATFCDLSKAFDCISHEILLDKLKFYGLADLSIKLLTSYLENRVQRTYSGGDLSEPGCVTRGVPQGSVLAPLLFLVYINDIDVAVERLILFADDTNALSLCNDFGGLGEAMGRDAERLGEWFGANSLLLNKDKTERVIFSMRDHTFTNPTSVRFLGVYLDPHLTFESHVDETSKKLNKAIYLLRNLRFEVGENVVTMVYHALFHSIATYAILVWGHSSHTQRIFGLQRGAIRAMMGMEFRAEVKPSFIKLSILTIPCQYILSCLIYAKKNVSHWSARGDIHGYHTRQISQLHLNFLRLKKSRVSTSYYAQTFYNKLPEIIKQLEESKYIKTIKSLLLRKAYYSLTEFLNDQI